MGMTIDISGLGKKEGRVLIAVTSRQRPLAETKEEFFVGVQQDVARRNRKWYSTEAIEAICRRLAGIGLLQFAERNCTWAMTDEGRNSVKDARDRPDCQKFFQHSLSPNVPETSDTASS